MMRVQDTFILLVCSSLHHMFAGAPVATQRIQRCAGDLFKIKCPINQLIYIEESTVYYRQPQDSKTECHFNETTCEENLSEQMHRHCAAQNSCMKEIGVLADRTMQCRGSIHQANHIEILYKCISVAAITDVCSISRVSLGEGFIASPRFPSSIPAKRSHCHCTIRSKSIFYIHLIEASLEAADNKCVEQLSFAEKKFCPNQTTGYYNEQMMIDKESSISFIRKVDGGPATGKFWLKYTAYVSGDEVTINCNYNRTSTDITADLIPLKQATACKQKNLTISCGANELIYIHEAEKGYINSSTSGNKCPSGNKVCKHGYDFPALDLCGSKNKCDIRIGNNRTIECNGRKFPENVIDIQYKCAPASKLVNICNKISMMLPEGFITSPGYPTTMHEEDLDCMCTVDTDDSTPSAVLMRLIEAHLMGADNSCMEELSVGDTTYCPTNSRTGMTSYNFHDKQHISPIRVHLKANGSQLEKHGKFWIRFYGFGRPLKVTCGSRPPSFHTEPVQSTTLGTTFHQESSTTLEIIKSSSATIMPTVGTSTVTSTVKTSIFTSTAKPSTVTLNVNTSPTTISSIISSKFYPSNTHSHGGGSDAMTTLTNILTNKVILTEKSTLSEQEETDQISTVEVTQSSTLGLISITQSTSTNVPTVMTKHTTMRTKITHKSTSQIEQDKKITSITMGDTTFHSEVTKAEATTGKRGTSPTKRDVTNVRTTRSTATPTVTLDQSSPRSVVTMVTEEPLTPDEIIQGTRAETAMVGGLIGGAAALILITVGLIMLLMYILKKKRGEYHMKPEKQSELPDKYTYT